MATSSYLPASFPSLTGGLDRRTLLRGALAAPLAVLVGQRGASSAQPGTPRSDARDSPVGTLLALAPDRLGDPEADYFLASYADLARQLGTVGIAKPTPEDAEGKGRWSRATAGLPLPPPYPQVGFRVVERWPDFFGYDLFTVDQLLSWTTDRRLVQVLRGPFDPEAVRATWAATGYVEEPGGEFPLAVLPEEAVGEEMPPIYARPMSHAAILPDGTLLFAEERAAAEEVLAVAAGAAGLSAQPPLTAIAAAGLPDLAAWILRRGESVASALLYGMTPSPLLGLPLDAEPLGEGEAPPPRTDVEPPLRAVFALAMPDEAAAEAAAARIESNLGGTMASVGAGGLEPADVFLDPEIRVADSGVAPPVVVVTATIGDVIDRYNFGSIWRLDPFYPNDLLAGAL